MEVNAALIEKFFANCCTAEEASHICAYFQENPHILDAYLQASWNETDGSDPVPENLYHEMLQAIKAGTFNRQSFIKKHMKTMGVAASFVLIAGTWWFVQNKSGSVRQTTTTAAKKAEAAPFHLEEQHNNTGKLMFIKLEDSSLITLSENATVKCPVPFQNNERNIYLEGQAFFEVAKDHTKPFTVFSGSFSVTALGTSFRVTESRSAYNVKLYTGKVVIRSVKPMSGYMKPVYLLPGQQMNYQTAEQKIVVNAFESDMNKIPRKNNKRINITMRNDEMVFDNAPLPAVMDKLIERYHIPIDYNKRDLSGMYFSGSVLNKDSISVILNVIGRMNGLTVAPKADGFKVSKSH